MKLYVISGSHPCAAAEAALRVKGLEHRTVELPHELHRPILRRRFGAATAPAMAVDGEKVQGTRAIMRRLDDLAPEPPLFPADRRAEVERAERFGEELQDATRRLELAALIRRPEAIPSYTRGSRYAAPAPIERRVGPLVNRRAARFHRVDDDALRADLDALPRQLDHVDELIRAGVIGGDPPNAADLQIGSSLKALSTLGDVRPLLEGRPALDLGERLFPDLGGSCPAGALASVHSQTDQS